MKRLIFCLIVLALVAVTACALAETYYVTTDIDALNVRDAYNSEIIYGCIRAGKKVNVDYIDKQSRWAYLKYDGHDAKVYFAYLTPYGDPCQPDYYGGKTGPAKPAPKKATPVARKYASTDEASMIYRVSYSVKNYLTVRDKKSDNAYALGKVYPGEELYVVRVGKVWARIIYDEGYAFVKCANLEKVDVNLPDEGVLKQVRVSDETTLNVRSGPGKKKSVVTTIPHGAYVKELETEDIWSYVYYSMNDTGYVMTKFLVPVDE